MKKNLLTILFLFFITVCLCKPAGAESVKIPKDTSKIPLSGQTKAKLEKSNISIDTQIFQLHGEQSIPLDEILQKKAYTKGVAAEEIGGEKKEQISLQKVAIENKIQKPITLLKELPERLQKQINKAKPGNEGIQEETKINLNKFETPKPAEIITEPTVSTPVNLANNEMPIKTAAIKTLGETRDQSAIPILKETVAKSPILKHEAATALAKIGDTTGIKILKEELQANELEVKIKAIQSFGEVKEAGTVPELKALLTEEENPVSIEVAFALAKSGDAKGIEKVKAFLQSKDEDMRLRAALALADIKDKSAIPALEDFLKNPKSGIRAQAATALGDVGDKSVIPILEDLIKTAYDFRIRVAASESILKLKGNNK